MLGHGGPASCTTSGSGSGQLLNRVWVPPQCGRLGSLWLLLCTGELYVVFLGVFLGPPRGTLGQGALGVGCIQGDDHREALNAGERAGSMEQLREP